MVMNGEKVRIWKETVVEFLEVLSQHLPDKTKKSHENPKAG
jgi:hypothetical protein